jgi:hypothetical protein
MNGLAPSVSVLVNTVALPKATLKRKYIRACAAWRPPCGRGPAMPRSAVRQVFEGIWMHFASF